MKMRSVRRAIATFAASVWLVSSAFGLCIYHGKMYAKTTVAQEYADSKWVVQVKVVAADDHWSDEGDSWTIYHLRVLTAFKGKPSQRIDLFTYRDSGGFYLDKGVSNDIGGKYLLFLDPVEPSEHAPAAAQDATEINYNCGQSKRWPSVTQSERRLLLDLAARTKPD